VEAISLADEVKTKYDVVSIQQRTDRFDGKLTVGVVDLVEEVDDVPSAPEASQSLASGKYPSTNFGHDQGQPALDATCDFGCILSARESGLG
jgi:hypothetical protein